jgi:hypothetical protein
MGQGQGLHQWPSGNEVHALQDAYVDAITEQLGKGSKFGAHTGVQFF